MTSNAQLVDRVIRYATAGKSGVIIEGDAPPAAANDNLRPTETPAPPSDPVEFVDPTTWEGTEVPPRKWYVPALIPSRTVTLLSGDGGLGKSLIALQLSIASALGVETMGLAPEPARVVYVGAEDEVDEFHRRIDDILKAFGRTFADLDGRFLLLPLAERDATLGAPDRTGRVVATPLFNTLARKVEDFRPGLVVLDTSADLFGGDEIKRAQVRQFVALLRGIALNADAAVVLLSHPSIQGMQSGSGTSGSTAWNNSVRSRLYLTADTGDGADADGRVLTTMKANYGKKGDALPLRWEAGVFVPNDGTTFNPGLGILNKRNDGIFVALLAKLNAQGQACSPNRSSTYAPTVMARHPDAAGIGKSALEQAMQRLLDANTIKVVTDGPPSKPRARLWVTAQDFGA